MRDFLKFTLASCLGVSIAIIIVSLLGFLGVASFISFAASSDTSQGIDLPSTGVLHLKLPTIIPDQTNNAQSDVFQLSQNELIGLQDMIRMIHYAKDDNAVKGIFLDLDQSPLGRASSTQLREALQTFKESGKFIYSYGTYFSQNSYHIASVADSVFLNPNGMIDFRGFGVKMPFLPSFLDKVGIEPQVFYAGDFKSATEPIRRKNFSEENKLQIREYLRDLYDNFLLDISEERSLTIVELEALADQFAIRSAHDAKRYLLVDDLMYYDQFASYIHRRVHNDESEEVDLISMQDYYKKKKSKLRYDEGDDDIAIVYFEGSIVGEGDQPGTITEEKYRPIFERLRKSKELKAVVLRVNSGGGSAIASDNIAREILELKRKGIPVVSSMGDVAASGGYYISAPGDLIFAEPSTLTGSIGVFAVVPSSQKLVEEYLEISFDTIGTGPYANSFSGTLALSEKEKEYFQNSVDSTYAQFLDFVATQRNMSVAEVHKVSQGRVWSGIDAQQHRLVDSIGNLDQAIAAAVALAEVENYEIKEYPRAKSPLQQFLEELQGESGDDPSIHQSIERFIAEELPAYKWKKDWEEMKGIQMRLPFYLEYQTGNHQSYQ